MNPIQPTVPYGPDGLRTTAADGGSAGGESTGGGSAGGGSTAAGDQTPSGTGAAPKAPRDLRLDVFRGLAMFIILIAHIPGNWWTLWIPARFGFSDAAEIFVFCSGMASAIAFGALFVERGWWIATARTAYRVYQVYWAQVGVFLIILAGSMALTESPWFTERDYIGLLNLYPFVNDPISQLPAFLTLTYVPNYFDILPMYLVILVLMPVMMLVWKGGEAIRPGRGVWVFLGVSLLLWAVASLGNMQPWLGEDFFVYREVGSTTSDRIWHLAPLDLPAEPWSGRPWFFNPFSWQLVFFLGFAFMMGWLPKPPVKPWLILLCGVWVAIHIVWCWNRLHGEWLWSGEPQVMGAGLPALLVSVPGQPLAAPTLAAGLPALGLLDSLSLSIGDLYRAVFPISSKTELGALRVLHFLAVAYLAWVAAGEGGRRLRFTGWMRHPMKVITTVGQQTLAVFIVGLIISRALGVVIDEWSAVNLANGVAEEDSGRTPLMMLVVNLSGFGLLILVAYVTAYFRRQPWRSRRPKPAAPSGTPA